MGFACDNPDCGISSGIHEGLTFGSGRLSDNGYWSRPCVPCARAFEAKNPEAAPCWPFGSVVMATAGATFDSEGAET